MSGSARRRRLVAFVLVTGLGTACGSAGGEGSAPATTGPSTVAAPTTSDALPDPSTTSDATPAALDAIDVRRCTFRWFDRYDVEVAVPASLAIGSSTDLLLRISVGDVVLAGATGSLVAEGPDVQVVEMRLTPYVRSDPSTLYVSRNDSLSPIDGVCEVVVDGSSAAPGAGVDLEFDLDPPASDGSPLGDLIAGVDVIDADLLPLATLRHVDGSPSYDRLYLAPGHGLETMTVSRDATCRTVTSSYRGAHDAFGPMVVQRHGCPPGGRPVLQDGWVSTDVPDPNWEVVVIGSPADVSAVVVDLQVVAVPDGEPADGPPQPAPDEWLDGYLLAHPELTELARYAWGEDLIAIVRTDEGMELEQYLSPVRYRADLATSMTGVMCEEYTIGLVSSGLDQLDPGPPAGFAWFVARDAGTTIRIDAPGLPSTADLRPVPSGELVGFLDLGAVVPEFGQFTVLDASGAPVPCTQ